MPRVLLTSFEPFGRHALNSSLEVGRALAADPPAGVEVDWLVLPVVAGRCVELAWQRVEETRPDAVVALGQSSRAAALRVEERAVNVDHFPQPDNAGNAHLKRPVVPGGPAAYPATAPADAMLRAVLARGLPAERSQSAGTFVCNHLFYGLLHRAALAGAAHRTAFLHLPLLPEQVPAAPGRPEMSGPQSKERTPPPTRPLGELVEAAAAAVAACVGAGPGEAAGWPLRRP
jgi:pyroglutamyl-peptidase